MKQAKIGMNFICDQRWEDMPYTKNGRFCDRCKHEVYDFTSMSALEINKAKELAGKELCGRFTAKQAYPDIIAPVVAPKALRSLTMFSALFMLSSYSLRAQSKDSVKTELPAEENEAATNDQPKQCTNGIVQSPNYRKTIKIVPLFTTNSRRYFLSKRFPFIHSRSLMTMGKF